MLSVFQRPPPFEPIRKIALEDLIFKVAFLVAIIPFRHKDTNSNYGATESPGKEVMKGNDH